MPDARCTRDLMRNVHKKCAHEHTGAAENIRHSLRNGFTAYNALSPVSHGLLPPSTPTSGRQDHTSLPYALMPLVSGTTSVHRNPSLVGNDRRRPSGWDGMQAICPDFSSIKAKYFLFGSLTVFLSKRNDLPAGLFWTNPRQPLKVGWRGW